MFFRTSVGAAVVVAGAGFPNIGVVKLGVGVVVAVKPPKIGVDVVVVAGVPKKLVEFEFGGNFRFSA